MPVQDGWNAAQVAASWGHLSLVRELVETYHGTVHRQIQVTLLLLYVHTYTALKSV